MIDINLFNGICFCPVFNGICVLSHMHSLTHSLVGFWGKCRSVVVIDPLVPAIITQWVEDTSGFHNLCLTKVSSHAIENPYDKRVLNVKHFGKKFLCILSVLSTMSLPGAPSTSHRASNQVQQCFQRFSNGGGPSPSLLLVKSYPNFTGCASTSCKNLEDCR